MKANKWWVLAAVLLLLSGAGAGAWWWLNIRHAPAVKTPLLTSEIPLPTFTLSVAKKGGMTGYLVLGMTVAVKGRHALPKAWLKSHDPQIRAAVLSSLLDLPDINQMNTSKAVRGKIRMAVSADMAHVLSPGFQVASVYITKLIVQ